MPIYETVYILRPDLSVTQVEEINQKYMKLISEDLENKAVIGRQEYWGLLNISFRMRKQRKGHYLMLNYEGASAIINEFERRMRLSEDVMRYMTIRLKTMPTEPSIIMRRMEERDDERSRRYNDNAGRRERNYDSPPLS